MQTRWRIVLRYTLCASSFLQQSSHPRYTTVALSSSSSPRRTLSKVYRDIAQRSNQITTDWPHSQALCQDCLVYNEAHGCYQLPFFNDGNGPLGVFGLLHRNEQAQDIMEVCHGVFDQFCSDVCTKILRDDPAIQAEFLEHWVLNTPSESDHISVAILQEHPSFLKDPMERKRWEPIASTSILELGAILSCEHGKIPAPMLELDAVLWTPDGALIAGFVETNKDGRDSSFDKLRTTTKSLAQSVLNNSTLSATRPKQLIHATVGRVVGLPQTTTWSRGEIKTHQQRLHEELSALACEYNDIVLPNIVSKIREEGKGTFELWQLSLLRNVRWMLVEYQEYSSWKIGCQLETS
jgi:hypothetical protein